MQHSLFEPLHSLQAHTMEKCQLAFTYSQAAGPSLFTISPLSPSPPLNIENSPSCFDHHLSCSLQADIITLPSDRKARSEQDLTFEFTHANQLPLISPSTFSATSPCSIIGNSSLSQPPPSHPRKSCQNSRDAGDDGSVASKLLSSITKSFSSPSLQLASGKESARETPYHKALKLKQMKLHHCAEELGTESSDNSSLSSTSEQIYEEKIDIEGNAYGLPPSFTSPNSHQESSLKSVRSLPNMSSALPLITNQSRCTRNTSFPPPLSHTLPTSSSSSDSLSFSLCAYRQDGRFILKETMVPSKHYLHASRTNGRLTLQVVTRDKEVEDEEEDGFVRQDDHKESSHRESQEENLAEVVEDEVCVKQSIGMHTIKDTNVAGSHLDISLERMKSTAHHHSHINNENNEEDDKSNVISNVITLSLQTSSLSTVTLHKAQVLSYPQRNHGFLSGNHDTSTFTQSKQNFMWESNLMPRAVAMSRSQCLQRKGSSSGGGGPFGGQAAMVPAFVMEEMRTKSLMKAVSELATSLMLEASYGNGEWCLAGEKKPLVSASERGKYGTIVGGYASDNIDNAILNGKLMGKDGQFSHGAKFGYNSSYFKEEEQASDGGKELHITTSPLNLNLQFSSSSSWEEWLQTLHCKELFDRHNLGYGLTKLPCIPTRS